MGLPYLSPMVRNMFTLPMFQLSVAIGLMLSDAYLQLTYSKSIDITKSKRNASFMFSQSFSSPKRAEYVMHVFYIFSHYCPSFPKKKLRMSLQHHAKFYYEFTFQTYSLPCFTNIHNLFYLPSVSNSNTKGIKNVPVDIFNLLTPVALAY
jgi:hypothetical protein